mgnify:CR=1 FL=1
MANKYVKYPLSVGVPFVIDVMSYSCPITVTIAPDSSGSVVVETSTTPYAAGQSGAATWVERPGGAVTVATTDAVMAPISALRFTASVVGGYVEING